MLQTIISALAVYVSTSIDYLLILMIIFSQSSTKGKMKGIVGGQYLGTGMLVAFSLFAAYVLNLIPEDWIIGLLGLDRKSTRLNSSHWLQSRMPSSA